MKLSKLQIEDVKSTLSGGAINLMRAFMWANTPQGHNYWLNQFQDITPLDRKTLIRWLHENGESWEEGTLEELNVQEGDVLAWVKAHEGYEYYNDRWEGVDDLVVNNLLAPKSKSILNGFDPKCEHIFRVISRANYPLVIEEEPEEKTYPTWAEMTPEEKGALLLAHHEGKEIEWATTDEWSLCDFEVFLWGDEFKYRIKPEPKVEEVILAGLQSKTVEGLWEFDTMTAPDTWEATHKITFNLVDGEPDCDSIQMEEL